MRNERNELNEKFEEITLRLLKEGQVVPLCKKLKGNGAYFRFISDREFAPVVGGYNLKCDKIRSRIDDQLGRYANIIGILNELEGSQISATTQQNIFGMVDVLKNYALKYGYNNEALELIKIIKNPNLVGSASVVSVDKDILTVISNYGKRAILENGDGFKDDVDQIIVDVAGGLYGQDTKSKLSAKKMEDAYKNTTIQKGDMVFKTDGSHKWSDGGRV